MDNDGDLDMYQVNQPADKKIMLINKIPLKDYKFFRDRIYRNDNGKFKNYHSFASSKLIDILPKDKMNAAVVYEISNFESIILINDKGILRSQSLPIEAQVCPIKDALVDDFNNVGFKDILIVGNHCGVELETVRYDAGYDLLLLGDGKHTYKPSEASNSRVHIPLDSRSITSININNEKEIILVTNNSGALILLQKNK
ncbi:MAG: hypothetical protein ACI9Z4_000111 [Polaribacter sp.]|jgi:hypothetical protein